jgi:hypothetical protein
LIASTGKLTPCIVILVELEHLNEGHGLLPFTLFSLQL